MNEDERSEAIRAGLIDYVTSLARRRRRWLVGGSVVAGVVLGVGGSTVAFAANGGFPVGSQWNPAMPSGQAAPSLRSAVDAPAGTQPGAPIVALLDAPVTRLVTGPTSVSLAGRPPAATHLRVVVTAVTAGSLSWGTDAGGNNPSVSVDADSIASGTASSGYDFPLDETIDALYFVPSAGFTGVATLQYVTDIPTHLATNAKGETYGVEGGPDGAPELIAVEGVRPDGSRIQGYARNVDLNASSPDHRGMPTSPAQALEWQDETQQRYPDGWDVPVYESDGATQIGTFHIGR